MPILLLKSILSVLMLFLAGVAMFTMFEIFGRDKKRYNVEKIKKLHKANGIIYLLIFIFVSYFCLSFVINSKSELTPRGTFHATFALTIIVLLGLKISFVRIYRQFYGQVKTIGLLIALLTFGMVGTSGGYYLAVTQFGTIPFKETKTTEEKNAQTTPGIVVRTDSQSIRKGKELYESKCYFCHDAYSNKAGVGPGHKGILKNPLLPVSKKPATPDNIANQLRNPYKDMPSFSYLSREDILNIIAFLNTL